MVVNRENILRRTHYGLNIYSHVLRQYYPDEIVLAYPASRGGRDCLPAKNPWNNNQRSLMIEIIDGIAKHRDLDGVIPIGNAFDFAERYFKLSDQELLEKLNEVMHLRIDQKYPFYPHLNKKKLEEMIVPEFSYFKAPIRNIFPSENCTLGTIYNLIRGNQFEERTRELRSISDPKQARQFKATYFDYVTFSGVFTKRSDQQLEAHSNLLTIDFDHIDNIAELKRVLLNDDYFDTELLFRSPSGDGLKWVIPIDVCKASHADYFKAVANYLKTMYQLEADPSGKDISRACFLPHDQEVYINSKYL